MVLTTTTTASWHFKAELFILRNNIRKDAQPIIHCKGVRQCAAVVAVTTPPEGGNNVIVASFTFMYRPEFVMPGWRVTVMLCGVAAIGTILKDEETASA